MIDEDYSDDFNFWDRMGMDRRFGFTILWALFVTVFILADNKVVVLLTASIFFFTWLLWIGFKKLVNVFVNVRHAYDSTQAFSQQNPNHLESEFEEEVEFIDYEREYLGDYEKEKFAEIVKTFYEK